jgi:hypothetical protein
MCELHAGQTPQQLKNFKFKTNKQCSLQYRGNANTQSDITCALFRFFHETLMYYNWLHKFKISAARDLSLNYLLSSVLNVVCTFFELLTDTNLPLKSDQRTCSSRIIYQSTCPVISPLQRPIRLCVYFIGRVR